VKKTTPVAYDIATDSMQPVTQADVDRWCKIETIFLQLCEETDFLVKTAKQMQRTESCRSDINLAEKFMGGRKLLRELKRQAIKESHAVVKMESGELCQ
jgi:hypothetical protein